ncbi:Hpt domain-containing protein [Haloferula sp.]|uniref:Hpt domain-containing protein n=1 Tax=Haloferula sp. TaxID=2497595 RepID=UPI00329FE14D
MQAEWLDTELLKELGDTVGELLGKLVLKFDDQLKASPLFTDHENADLTMSLHKLAGSSASLGMTRLAEALKKAENQSRAGDEIDPRFLRELATESVRRLIVHLDHQTGESP